MYIHTYMYEARHHTCPHAHHTIAHVQATQHAHGKNHQCSLHVNSKFNNEAHVTNTAV